MRLLGLLILWGILILSGTAQASPQLSKAEIRKQIEHAARTASLDPKLVEAVVRAESNYDLKAKSHKGAMGLMQVMPATADQCNIHDPYHPTNHLMGAARCLRKLINKYQGNLELALAAYNAGEAAVKKYNGVPPYEETREYIAKVMRFYEGKTAPPKSKNQNTPKNILVREN